MSTRSSGATSASRASSPTIASRVGRRSASLRTGDASRVMRAGSMPTRSVSKCSTSVMSLTQPLSEPPPSYASMPISRMWCWPMSQPGAVELGGLHDVANERDVTVDPRVDAAVAASPDRQIACARRQAGDLAHAAAEQEIRRAAAVAVAGIEALPPGDELAVRGVAVPQFVVVELVSLAAAQADDVDVDLALDPEATRAVDVVVAEAHRVRSRRTGDLVGRRQGYRRGSGR